MFLSQLLINSRYRGTRRDLSDRYKLHRTLLSAFLEVLPSDERVRLRVEERPRQPNVTVPVQSQERPDVRAVEARVSAGLRLPFRLQANPRIKRASERHAIVAETDLADWLQRKGEQHGFAADPQNMRSAKLGNYCGRRR